jgi:DTW domain-containing protein YfiP
MVQDPTLRWVVLYPGSDSLNLTEASDKCLLQAFPQDGKKLGILLIDGTWSSAKRMIRTSVLLSSLPKISFSVNFLSQFRFKKQPRPNCLSTVEATTHLIESLALRGLCSVDPPGAHWKMLHVFDALVETQLKFMQRPRA